MGGNELHKLKRVELLRMLVTLSEENEKLHAENDELRTRLESRKVELENAGSIADASVQISDVFKATQNAADLYLTNISRLNDESQKNADALMEETRRQCEKLKADTQQEIQKQQAVLEEWVKRYEESERKLSATLAKATATLPDESISQEPQNRGKVAD